MSLANKNPGTERQNHRSGQLVLMENASIQRNNTVIPVGKPESSRQGWQRADKLGFVQYGFLLWYLGSGTGSVGITA
jgi:hypothetical protein